MFFLMLSAHLTLKTPSKEVTLNVDVPQTTQEKYQGLNGVEHLPLSKGMLFIFPKEDLYAFTMQKTAVELALFFFDANKKLIEVKVFPAFYPHLIFPTQQCQYVLEASPDLLKTTYFSSRRTELFFSKKKLDE